VVTASSPTVFKRYVALQLRSLREATELRREQVAEHLGCTVGHVRHLETLISLPKPLEVRALLPLYGVPERVDPFLALVDAARRGKDWWTDFPGVPSWLELLLGMEAAAATIHSYDTMVIRGLFQTPAYAAALIRGGEPDLPDAEVQQRVELRLARQDVLTRRPEPPSVWCVLDESVLHRRAEDPAVLAEQLEHLTKLGELPNVHIQVLPFDGLGLHAGMNGTFTVLTFGPELVGDPGVAYTESRISGTYYEDPAEIMRYRDTWSRVQLLAHTPETSRAILARRLEEITA
jgi:transcriptional regulator with XRE-family HTH domain